MGCAFIRGWALINFFCLQDGCLFEVGTNLRLGAYSNKYCIQHNFLHNWSFLRQHSFHLFSEKSTATHILTFVLLPKIVFLLIMQPTFLT